MVALAGVAYVRAVYGREFKPSSKCSTLAQSAGPPAGAADRLRKRDGKPEWVPLSSLRPGTVFEAQSGWRGVKTADEAPALGIAWCTELGNGKRVQTHIGTIVKEIL